MLPSPISVKNLIEKLKIFSQKRISSHNVRNEVNNEKASIHQQINNSTINKIEYYEHKCDKAKEKVSDQDKREGIPIYPIIFDSETRGIWNKVF